MRRLLGAVLLGALAAGAAARADTRQARFTVATVVPARVTFTTLDQPTALTLDAADVERGYKDVGARYQVSHNDGRGYLLHFTPRAGLTRVVEVRGLAADLVLHDMGVEVLQAVPTGRHELMLEFRFVLGPEARPGSYGLPVHVTATPL